MIKFMVTVRDGSIDRVQIKKETKLSVLFQDKLYGGSVLKTWVRKISKHYRYFDTYRQAKDWVIG